MQVGDVEMDDVELARATGDLFHHQQVVGEDITQPAGQTLGLGTYGDQLGLGFGIAAGKQRHLMALTDKLVCQKRHDPFGAAVEFRRNTFAKRRNLSDSHDC